MSSKLSIIVKNSTAEPLDFSGPVNYSIMEGSIASPPQIIAANGKGAGGVFTFSKGLSVISVYESPDPKYVWILFVRAFSTVDIIAKTLFYPAKAGVDTVLVNDIQNSAAYGETATHVCTSVGVNVTFEATSQVNGELGDDLDDLDDDLDDLDDDLSDGPDEDLYVEFNLTAKATQPPYDEDSEEDYNDDDSVTSSPQEPQRMGFEQVFTGAAELTCHEFIRSIRESAIEAGKQRDDIWMADHASIRFGGEALKWFESLDEEVQADWKQLRRAIMARYDTPVYEEVPSSQSKEAPWAPKSSYPNPPSTPPPALCPTCLSRPIAKGFQHCSMTCATSSTPNRTPPPPPPRPYSRASSSVSTPSRPAPRPSVTGTTLTPPRIALCPVCEEKPPYPGYRHCSIECVILEKNGKVAQPVNLARMWLCETCGEKVSAAGYKYCSPECSKRALSLEDTFSQLSVSSSSIGPQKCVIEGCNTAEWKPGSRYCGNICGATGVALGLDPACLFCEIFPKMNKSFFCSGSCSNNCFDSAPLLLYVPTGHEALRAVTDRWAKEWMHTANPPQIRFLWLIVQNMELHNAFEAKLTAIDASYNFKAEGMFPANELRRWHGIERECTVGDPGTTLQEFCKSPTCSMCIVMQWSFYKEWAAPGSTFGKGVYTRGTSSGSHGDTKQVAPSPYRAMLMCRVLAGKAKRLTQADRNLVAAPPGYDSVQGVPGGGLSSDELVVYDNNQIRPLYLVIYDRL